MGVAPDRIMYNHGVHGVMDFAAMLCRRSTNGELQLASVPTAKV